MAALFVTAGEFMGKTTKFNALRTLNIPYETLRTFVDSTRTLHDLRVIAALLADLSRPWVFCGGWAIDLFLIGRRGRTRTSISPSRGAISS